MTDYERGVRDAIAVMWKRATRHSVVGAVYPKHTERQIIDALLAPRIIA